MAQPQVIVVGNEKGGAGKSTLAIHIVTGLLHAGHKVAIIDLDLRQQSMAHFFSNRAAWTAANGHSLPMPIEPDLGDGKALARAPEEEQLAAFERVFAEVQGADAILILEGRVAAVVSVPEVSGGDVGRLADSVWAELAARVHLSPEPRAP